jgi:hypothetical protein
VTSSSKTSTRESEGLDEAALANFAGLASNRPAAPRAPLRMNSLRLIMTMLQPGGRKYIEQERIACERVSLEQMTGFQELEMREKYNADVQPKKFATPKHSFIAQKPALSEAAANLLLPGRSRFLTA